MKYIFITYLPGSAGNFFSRCLNLLSGAYCYGQENNLPTTLEQKLKMLNYESILDRSLKSDTWVTFERKLIPYHEIIRHFDLPPNSYSIWAGHGFHNTTLLAGSDDQIFNFYIDPGNSFEWSCMNALYKNSYLNVDWFICGKKLLNDTAVYKIKLDNFLIDWDCFLLEFLKVIDIIGHTISESEIRAVRTLYNQWKTTILKHQDIETFKKDIGFFM